MGLGADTEGGLHLLRQSLRCSPCADPTPPSLQRFYQSQAIGGFINVSDFIPLVSCRVYFTRDVCYAQMDVKFDDTAEMEVRWYS